MADWPAKKNAAFTVVFPIYDADGDLVTGATGLDSEVSKDGGTFTDVTPDEASEIATSSGIYELDLTSTEMNADVVAVRTLSNGKPAVNVMYTVTRQLVDLAYPATSGRSIQVETDGVVHADVKEWLASAPLALASQRVQVEVDAYDSSVDFNATQKASINTEADQAATDYDAIVPADLPTNFGSMGIEADGHVHGDLKEWLGAAPLALASQRPQVEVDAYDASVDFNATQKASINTEADQAATDYDAVVPADLPTNFSSMGIEADGHVHGDLKEWLGVAPNALQSGRIDSYVGAMAAGVLTSAAIATAAIDADAINADAIGSSEFAQAAADKIWSSAARTLTALGFNLANTDFSAGAIDAAAIAADAIGASELAADAANEIADAILSRDVDNVESTAAVHTLCSAILKAVSRVRDNAGTLEVYETNGTTLHMSQTVTVDSGLDPIDELTVGS